MEQKLTQEEFNKILKSKENKIISIDNYTNYFTYYIRKIEKEKLTSKDYLILKEIKDISNIIFKDNNFYIEFNIKL